MIKRNGDNVVAIASNNECQGARNAVSLYPSPGPAAAAATRIPRATAARMTPPEAHHSNSKEANIALSTYVEKWKNRYEDAERKHKTYLLKSEKGQLFNHFPIIFYNIFKSFPLFCEYFIAQARFQVMYLQIQQLVENPILAFVGI